MSTSVGSPKLKLGESIKALKNGKAPGEDGICPEMLKAEEVVTSKILCTILQQTMDTEDTPEGWETGTVVKLPKRGDLGDCSNWRG